jgi:hypothetical protein
MKRTSEVLSILGKIGYTIDVAQEIETPVSRNTQATGQIDLVMNRIKGMHTWDEKLLEHTYMRINSMSENQLRARVGKIKDKDKMLYFAKVLMDKGRYPSVLRECIRAIIDKGW